MLSQFLEQGRLHRRQEELPAVPSGAAGEVLRKPGTCRHFVWESSLSGGNCFLGEVRSLKLLTVLRAHSLEMWD